MLLTVSALLVFLRAPAPVVSIRFPEHCVSVTAERVPLRGLLTEWARVGRMKLSGLEQISDRPTTLRLDCADERRTLEALLEGADPLLVPREVALAGASAFVAVVILGRDASLPRRPPLAGSPAPEAAFPDPMPGRDWSNVQADPDAPPPIVLQPVAAGSRAPSADARPPEARFEYTRPSHGALQGLPAEGEISRTPEDLRALADAARRGAAPESLFDYPTPAAARPDPDRSPRP